MRVCFMVNIEKIQIEGHKLMYHVNEDLSETNNLLENPTSEELKLASQMNQDMVEWLQTNNAPTGTWVKDGSSVPYPKEDGVRKYKK